MEENGLLNEEQVSQVSGGYSGPFFTYLIKKSDSLSVLAQRYKTTVAILCELNHIGNTDILMAGNTLLIPYKG